MSAKIMSTKKQTTRRDVSFETLPGRITSAEFTRRMKRAELWTERIKVALVNGQVEQVADLAQLAAAEIADDDEPLPPLLATPLGDVTDDLRLLNALEEEHDVITVGELLALDDFALRETPNVSEVTIRSLLRELARHAVKKCLELEAEGIGR